MHGYAQGELMARHICDNQNIDVLFIQESFSISAMEHAVSSGIIIGRPFGGVATLINNKYKDFIIDHNCSKRFNIISLGDIALINVYLPSITNNDSLLLFNTILSDISTDIEKLSFKQIVFGGDMNCGPTRSNKSWNILLSYLSKFGLHSVEHKPNAYTFSQEKVGSYKFIDHFFTDCNVASILKVNSIDMIDHHTNFSDHLPVFLSLAGNISELFVTPIQNMPNYCNSGTPCDTPSSLKIKTLNWDLADTNK